MRLLFTAIATGATIFPAAARAVIVYGPQARNVGAPTGTLSTAGYQYEGYFGGFTGTPIAPNYFISAEHIGGGIGQAFTYQGTDYTTTAVYDSPTTDLRIWKVSGTFPSYAPLYTPSDGSPIGKQMFVTGRGLGRGGPLYLPTTPVGGNGGVAAASTLPGTPGSPTQSTQRQIGWDFAQSDGAITWGTNTVDSVLDGGSTLGNVIGFDFDSDQGDNEATLAFNDSAGGLYVNTGGTWKLAGINYGIDGFHYTLTDDISFGAIYDARGLYLDNGASRLYFPVNGAGFQLRSFASSIGDNYTWIQGVTGLAAAATIPEPASVMAIGTAVALLARRRRNRSSGDRFRGRP